MEITSPPDCEEIMRSNTLLLVGLGVAGYFFLTTRQPVFAKAADGSYQPAGLLDRMTVALTGAQAPTPQNVSVSVPGLFNVQYTG
jgi:hypothetical protein